MKEDTGPWAPESRNRDVRVQSKTKDKEQNMLEFFTNFLNNASHLIDLGRRQVSEAIEPVVSKKKSIATNKMQTELEALGREFGELKAGKRIVVQLRDMLRILPRERRRADAYKGLKAELNRNGIDLIITSNRSHKNNKKDE